MTQSFPEFFGTSYQLTRMYRAWLLALLFICSSAADETPLPHRNDPAEQERSRVARITKSPVDFSHGQAYEAMAGGAATSNAIVNAHAFSHPSANLTDAERADFFVGNGIFKKNWVSAPASTQASDGLGPLFNARSCQACHLKDGRGHPPADADDSAVSMVLQLSVPTTKDTLQTSKNPTLWPEPTYGVQLQDLAVAGLPAEGRMRINYQKFTAGLSDGSTIMLRRPSYRIIDLGYGPMAANVQIAPRVAPPMIGMGLLEAIHPGDILALADPYDLDGDGISGRASWIIDPQSGKRRLGRFGWQATTATVHAQTVTAFANDMGISTPDLPVHSGDCTRQQPQCLQMPHGEQPRLERGETNAEMLRLVVFYAANLAVPKRRDAHAVKVLAGKALFHSIGCASCHRPNYVTSKQAHQPAHRFQLIWPYTDLLLHDMGADLADRDLSGNVHTSEWRTAPLWGIGLTETVNGHTFFLHDGRARNLTEAILWHGGEAQAAREGFASLSADQRADLLRFLESL